MVKHSIKVYARLKYQGNGGNSVVYQIVKKEEQFDDIVFYHDVMQIGNSPSSFRFHKVFDQESKQEDVFDNIAKPVINSVLQGFNGTIFAYGQTGSGKTYSITGSPKNYNDRGIIPRTIQYVFAQNEKVTIKPTIYISYMEIYNEIGYDLLCSRHDNSAKSLEELPRIVLLEDSNGEVHIRNLSVLSVATEQEAMRLLFLGDTNRTIAETPMNEYSSRSHCIFTIYTTFRDESSNTLRYSKLHLVDLAGSERVYKSLTTGTALREAKHINLSLHYLQQVILALSESKRLHIPYRNSMMTYILKDSLSGNCLTAMLATLALTKDNIQETISTCRFAQRVSLITTAPIINEIEDPQKELSYLRGKVEELRKQISMLTGFSVSTTSSVINSNQEEQCKKEIEKYLAYPQEELKIEPSMAHIQFCFNIMKSKINNQKAEHEMKELEFAQSRKEITSLKDTIIKQDQELNSLRKIVVEFPEKSIASNSTMYVKNNLAAVQEPVADTNRNSLVNYVKSKENQYFKSKEQYYENLSKFDNYTSETETERQLFEIFLKNPENAKDLEFYTNTLEKKLEIAKIYADTIDQCQKNITYIRQQLQTRSNYSVKNKLLIELEEQQKVYSRSLEDLKTVKNETFHLKSGLKKAEIRTIKTFKNWLDQRQAMNAAKNSFRYDENYYTYKAKQNILSKTSSKDCSCQTAREEVPFGCCNTGHSQSCWANCCNEDLYLGPICQPMVVDQRCFGHTDDTNIYKDHSQTFNNGKVLKAVRESDNLSVLKGISTYEEQHKMKICQSCALLSSNKNWNSCLARKTEANDHRNICNGATSQQQNRGRHFISELNRDEYKDCRPDPSDTTIITACNVKECYKCPYPSVVDISEQQRSDSDELYVGNLVSEQSEEKTTKEDLKPTISNLFLKTDSTDFKEFMRTVSLTGDLDIDKEIFSFYRNKFCS